MPRRVVGSTVSFRNFRFYLLTLAVVGLGLTLVGCGSGGNTTFRTNSDGTISRIDGVRGRKVTAELTVNTSRGLVTLRKGMKFEDAEPAAPQASVLARGDFETHRHLQYAAPPNFPSAQNSFVFLDEQEPVGYLPYDLTTRELVPTRTEDQAFSFGDLDFRSVSIFFKHLHGDGFVQMVVTPPAGIEEVEIPTLDGGSITTSPPVTLRQEYELPPSTGGDPPSYAIVEIFANGTSLGSYQTDSGMQVGLRIPTISGTYQVDSQGEFIYNFPPDNPSEPESASYSDTIPIETLEFANSFEPLEVAPNGSVTISNSFAWAGGQELYDPKWSVYVTDIFDQQLAFVEGTGPDIEATVDLAQTPLRTTSGQNYVLIPAGTEFAQQIRERAILARVSESEPLLQSETVPLFYQVRASDEVVPARAVVIFDGNYRGPARYYAASESVAGPAVRIKTLEIYDNPFFPDDPSVPEEERFKNGIYVELL